MQERSKGLLFDLLTEEQIKAIEQLKDSLKPEEINELRTAGEQLLKNVKTREDLLDLIESAAQSGPPDIKSPRLRQMIGGIARDISSETRGSSHSRGSHKRAVLADGTSPIGRRRRQVRRKKR